MTVAIKKILRNEYTRTIIVVGIILLAVFGLWFGAQHVLNTKIFPALAVVSGSMCVPYDGACDGWTSINHPFARTLHKGDIIIIQGVDPKTLNADYPNSDIIVFHRPDNPSELIVHRIISEEVRDGKIYFLTKGDGNNPPDTWPNPATYHDPWGEVSEDLVVGKVIMRIPWIGWIAIKMQELGATGTSIVVPLIVVIIVLYIIVEFVVPMLRNRRKLAQQKTTLLPNADAPIKKIRASATQRIHTKA